MSTPAGGRARRGGLPGRSVAMSSVFLDYDLPPHLIAQSPCPERDHSRLLVVRRSSGALEHRIFRDLPDLLDPADLLVLNDTRVVPARLLGHRQRTGGKWEGLFLQALPDGCWELLCQAGGRLREGDIIEVEPGPLQLELLGRAGGHWLAKPNLPGSAWELLERFGHVPLPPYIRKGRAEADDRQRYQTVYARRAGAVAAPTAGLHFTPRVFDRLRERGIGWTFLTLHVGLGTFQPIQEADYTKHVMHREWGELPAEAAEALTACRRRGGRIVAIGTTTVRVLETVAQRFADRYQSFEPWTGDTDLYIHPPYTFRAVDALVTNFHLPRSTLLLLVGAFTGPELLRRAYEAAIAQGYRFYSYGDAMLAL
ncbi:MAG: tRNA preQ1(34) S-adenosylmethionine ribosyltransferase-isomerase QueA [Gemmataceae bacterium]|nr:tRNA preQ1(34) S-adenosylmethionine ribosyltransferase-isomerase QueA [Gemmataceae bacterium]